jgi:hypothetical protein
MADMLRAGQEWLANQLKAHVSTNVVYQRGANQVSISATIGRTLLKLEDGYGAVHMQWTDRDFLILHTDLVFGATQTLPERGDTIREMQSGKVYIYEVMAPGSEPHWRWSDPHRKLLRIHTKQIGIE